MQPQIMRLMLISNKLNMKINIQKSKLLEKMGPYSIAITERLPVHVNAVRDVEFYYTLEKFKEYFLLTLDISAVITIECQRCMHDFEYQYSNSSNIAICKSDEIAERVMELHDSIVSPSNDVDFMQIITDDLHLFCPIFHDDFDACGSLN